MKRYLFVILALIFVLLTFTTYQYFKFNDGKLHIVFCDVGEGDGIFIRTPKGISIIEDAGPNSKIDSCISNHAPFWERTISLMLLSHPHADHMTGMISILKSYKVSAFATEGLVNTTSLYNELVRLIREKNVQSKILNAGDNFKTKDGVIVRILGPTKDFAARTPRAVIKESSEDASLITLVSFGNFDAVLTGDAPLEEVQQIASLISSRTEVLQIPHHGSRFNLDQQILEKISPQLAVISVGKNTYGHPNREVLEFLKNLGIKFLRTDQRGDVEIIADKDGSFVVR